MEKLKNGSPNALRSRQIQVHKREGRGYLKLKLRALDFYRKGYIRFQWSSDTFPLYSDGL